MLRLITLAALASLVGASTIVLYASVQAYDGNRAGQDPNLFCQEGTLGLIFNELNCRSALGMLLYNGESFASFVVNQSAPVLGITAQPVAANWSQLVAGQLVQSLYAADVLPSTQSVWWSGANPLGQAGENCGDWTNSGSGIGGNCVSGSVGSAAYADNRWMSWQLGTCNRVKNLLCACLGAAPLASRRPTLSPSHSPTHHPTRGPSKSPSHSPTHHPSKSPTTSKPSHSPTVSPSRKPTHSPTTSPTPSAMSVYLYPAYALGTGRVPGSAIGSSICPGVGGCLRGAPLLCYSTSFIANLPTLLDFNPHVPVNGFLAVIATNWTNFMTQTLLSDLNDAMVGMSGGLYTGCAPGGTAVSSNGNCGDWTSASGNGEAGSITSTAAATWMAQTTPLCTQPTNYACVCINQNTASPTAE